MIFKGHVKTSFIDYPKKISTVLFTRGCNFKCPFCHNSELLNIDGNLLNDDYIFDFLNRRKKYLDAVCISGGEPTLNNELVYYIKEFKKLGYLIKLDTNGTNPDILQNLIENKYLDYIAMDIKGPLHKYNDITKTSVNLDDIKDSIKIIKNSNIDYEFRTTVCKELLSHNDILDICNDIEGASRYIIQNFTDNSNVLIGEGKLTPYKKDELNKIENVLKYKFNEFNIR